MISRRCLVQYSKFSTLLQISPRIKQALKNGEGVVALESTVITHGLPYPHNLKTARALEKEVELSGSHPATIAILDGKIHVGLENDQLEKIASSKDSAKVSTRDIAKTIMKRQIGGTTVASTMKIANAAGIKVFSTGGIGGVHRGADQTFDISADLQELARTPICVVCSGVKSILDTSKTVEYLETHSVNCVVYGQENVFPSFFTRKSNCKGQFNTENLEDVAELLRITDILDLNNGTLLACPIPEKFAADGNVIQMAIDQALKEARDQRILSQNVTPFILARVNELTDGASMKTNIALLRNNAKIGGQLAKRISDLKKKSKTAAYNYKSPLLSNDKQKPTVVSIGATIVDFEAITSDDVKEDGGSYTGEIVQRMGGVARNHADALARLGCNSILLSAVGDDTNADFFRQHCRHIDIRHVETIRDSSTCTYLSMNFHGNVKYGLTMCEPLLQKVTPELITRNEDIFKTANFILLDGNLPLNVISKSVEFSKKYEKRVWFEPTDIKKVRKIFETGMIDSISATSPNANEFLQWAQFCNVPLNDEILHSPDNVLDFIDKQRNILFNLDLMVVSLSIHGSAIVYKNSNGQFEFRSLKAPMNPSDVISVSGAGDSFNSGVIAGILNGKSISKSLEIGQNCAQLTLESTLAVSDKISPKLLQ